MPSVFPPVVGNSLEDLARAFELPIQRFVDTVREYNQSVIAGKFDHNLLDDCHTQGLTPPKSHWAQTIDKPPFWGYPLRPGITFTYLGVGVTDHAQVKFEKTGISENIFAAGEIMAGNILGKGYLAGFGMTIGAVFGRIAGASAVAAVNMSANRKTNA